MTGMLSVAFWRATAERAVRAFAAALLSSWVVAGQIFDVRGVDWGSALGVGGGAAVVSVLLSLVATQVGSPASPSFVSDPAAAAKPPATGTRLAGYPGGHVTGGHRWTHPPPTASTEPPAVPAVPPTAGAAGPRPLPDPRVTRS